MALFGNDLDPGERYLYHYTSAESLARILDAGTLRLGPYANTNDPRENREWFPSMSMGPDFDEVATGFDFFRMGRDVGSALRRRASLACLTMDRTPTGFGSSFGRGWGRPRMWSQYADAHRGACLIFDHAALDAAITRHFPPGTRIFRGEVVYSEDFDSARSLHVRAEDMVERGAEAVADALIATWGADLFFEKNVDWSTESEYRFVVFTDAPVEFVEIRTSLRGIVVGMDVPAHELSVLRTRTARLGRPELPVAHAQWRNGAPVLLPAAIS